MSIIILVLAICAFIFSFIPIIGNIVSIVCGISSIVLSFILKKNKKLSIISVIVSIISLIICAFTSIVFTALESSNLKEVSNSYDEVLENYPFFCLNEEIQVGSDLILKLNEVEILDRECVTNISIKCLNSDFKLSLYDFFLYDISKSKMYFPKYCVDEEYLNSSNLNENELKEGKIKFIINDDYDINNLYIIYKNNSGIKIKLQNI